MYQSFVQFDQSPSKAHSVHHLMRARMGEQARGNPKTDLEPLHLNGDGQVDDFMSPGPDAIRSFQDERIVKFVQTGQVPEGWNPCKFGSRVVGFSNESQQYLHNSASNPSLTTRKTVGDQLWSHSINPRQEGLLVTEACKPDVAGPAQRDFNLANDRTPQVCTVADRYVEVSPSGKVDGPFEELVKTSNVVWHGFRVTVPDNLQDAWNAADKGMRGEQSSTMVARDRAGEWKGSHTVTVDNANGKAEIRVSLPAKEGFLHEIVRGDFADGRLIPDSVTKTIRHVPASSHQ